MNASLRIASGSPNGFDVMRIFNPSMGQVHAPIYGNPAVNVTNFSVTIFVSDKNCQ
jgi:hypothetical protein